MSIEVLLNKISIINNIYADKIINSGENFNIFQVLNLDNDELFHSKFLSVLLDPKKSHNKGMLFLEKFLSVIGIVDFQTTSIKVEIEKHIGNIDKKYNSGGRIDIIISDRKTRKKIIIENKINAGDQHKQLKRYWDYDKNAHLIYLTLFGTEASYNSIGTNSNIKYEKISYYDHILSWINKCIAISSDNLILKGILIQYRKLVQKITFQTRSIEMKDDIVKLLMSNKTNIMSAITIADNISDLKETLIKKYLKPVLIKISKKHNLILEFPEEEIGQQYWGWHMYKKEWNCLAIHFGFEHKDFTDLLFGFTLRKPSKRLHNYLKKLPGDGHTKNFPLWNWFDEYSSWNEEIFPLFLDKDNDIFILIEDKIEGLLKIIDSRNDL
jgi:hypothetical protein